MYGKFWSGQSLCLNVKHQASGHSRNFWRLKTELKYPKSNGEDKFGSEGMSEYSEFDLAWINAEPKAHTNLYFQV